VNEEKLIQLCIKANRKAQRELFDATYSTCFRLSVRYLGNHHDAEDVVSEAFVRIFQQIGSFVFHGEGSLRRWINTIVINESLRFLKRRKMLVFEEDLLNSAETFIDISDLTDIDTEQVEQIISIMPVGYRTVFNLFAVEGFSHGEIAELLSITENTSRSQLSKARRFIIQRLKTSVNYENA
jgi:RNA polymerase sigma-70 factor (ECF subfamily)